jgi:cytochrome P450
MLSLTGFLVSFVASIIIYSIFFKKDGKNYPKGPFPLPFIGNGLALRNSPGKQIQEWAKSYGDVFQLFFGKERTYVITDLKLAKELFNDPVFSSRPDSEIFHLLSDGPSGILSSSGQVWSEQRRFTLRHLRDFGFGKNAGEEMIMNEVNEFLKTFSNQQGVPFVINRTFQAAVLNTLWEILAGVRFEQDDPRLWSVFRQNKELSEILNRNPVMLLLPKLAKLVPGWSGWNKAYEVAASMKSIVQEHIKSHRDAPPDDGVPHDFIDAYLKEVDSTTDVHSSFHGETGIHNLGAVIGDLFGAGFETVTLTLSWATIYLVRHQEIQKKFQDELDSVVGRNRYPTLADRPLLPFVEATIAESMRCGTIVPLGLFHVAAEDTKIRAFDVPKGSWVIAPLYGFHFDENYFPSPNEFKPERFLSTDEKSFRKNEALVPFAFGKRACLGETLARDEVFLFLTNMFHRFCLKPAPENPTPSLEPTLGFGPAPRDYKVIVTERS